MTRFLFVLLLLTLLVTGKLYSLDTVTMNRPAGDSVLPGCVEKDIMDIIFRRKPLLQDTIEKVIAVFVPYVGYSPTTGILFGVGGNFSFRFGRRYNTNLSAASTSLEVTTKKQVILQLKSNVYAGHNRWFLQGDWRFYLFNIPVFGLGTGNGSPIPEVPGTDASSQLPQEWWYSYGMQYSWLRIHEICSRKVVKNFYAGIGYHLDWHFDIVDKSLEIDSVMTNITPHYAYSTLHGFSTSEYTVSGLSLNFVYDSRDNIINPYKGYYVNINYLRNFTWLGSDQNASRIWTEFRTYVNVEKKIPRHLIAFWLYGSFQVSGAFPYLDLRATGFDQMNSSGRGYLQGRWRGENLVYGEVEYRFPITRCSQVLGGAVFFNASTASSKDLGTPLFGYIKTGGGVGLRLMVSKKSRTNILLDFAIGDMSKGMYVQAVEAF